MDNQTKIIEKQTGVPKFICTEFNEKTKNYCLLIPVINEGKRIKDELERAFNNNVSDVVDIVICDSGSIDKSVEDDILKKYNVNTRLIKDDIGKQGAQLRMGIWWALKLIHAPIISLTAKHILTDTTNNFRAYSRKYLSDSKVAPLRDIFEGYELLAYLSTRASQLGYKVCEVPVTRTYPKNEKVPTKISAFSGNFNLLSILFYNFIGKYNKTICGAKIE